MENINDTPIIYKKHNLQCIAGMFSICKDNLTNALRFIKPSYDHIYSKLKGLLPYDLIDVNSIALNHSLQWGYICTVRFNRLSTVCPKDQEK